MEEDLFGSSTLFTSFESKNPDSKKSVDQEKSTKCEILGDSREVVSQCSTEDGDSAGEIPEVADFNSSLIVLDETGSEGSNCELEETKEVETVSNTEIREDSESAGNLNGAPDDENPKSESNRNSMVKTVAKAEQGCDCAKCPHLETIEKLKQENEELRRQIEEIEVRHKINVERAIKNGCCSCSVSATVTKYESYSGFCIDKGGVDPIPSKEETWQVPSYNTSYSEALKTEIEEEEDINAGCRKSSKSCCFNCLGDHMLTECPETKDPQKIFKNRQEFMSRNGGRQARYHAEDDLRFSRFQPGQISDELRRALDLGKKDLPSYIYKMRRLGYPPGWLKEAEVSSSGISLYDSEKKDAAVAATEENEDGEVTEATPDPVKYDQKLLIAYPGFNVSLSHGVRDEWRRLGYLPMQEIHTKTFASLRRESKGSKSSKRKRRRNSSGKHSNSKRSKHSNSREEVDMDIDDDNGISTENGLKESNPFVEPLPPGVCPNGGASPPTGHSGSDSNVDSSPAKAPPPSPSLEALESAKECLLNVLADEKSDSAEDVSEPQTPKAEEPQKSDACSTNGESKGFSASKFVQLGSPSIFRASKGMLLPTPEKFATGISEHIPFENLPDSVGKFSTMKKILKKVRRVMSDL